MIKFKEVYSWDVLDKVEEGKKVFMLDKGVALVMEINSMSVFVALKWLATAKEDHDRFYFWYDDEAEEQEGQVND